MSTLEAQVTELLKQNPAMPAVPAVSRPSWDVLTPEQQKLFAEDQNGMGMPRIGSFMRVSGNLLVMALGVIAASAIGGILARYIPMLGQWSTVLAGAILIMMGKQGLIRDFGFGVLLGGLAIAVGPMLAGLTGSFGEREQMMQETKMTYGGSDGVYPEQPGRRVFS